MSAVGDQNGTALLLRTRRTIVTLAAVPACLFVLGLLAPPGGTKDVIAVFSIGIWLIVFPGLLLAGLVVPLVLSRSTVTSTACCRRVVRATLFSCAALVLVIDFWLFGIFAGLKWHGWMYELIPAVAAILIVLLQIPTRSQFERWSRKQVQEAATGQE